MESGVPSFKNFFDLSPNLMGVVEVIPDDILHIIDNPLTASYFGRTSEQMANVRTSSLGISREVIELWASKYRESQATGTPVQFDYVQPPPLRSTFSVIVKHLGTGPTGNPRFLYIMEDITARKKQESELERSQDSLIFALESARMGTWEIDLRNNRVYCSATMLSLWGVDPKDFHGDRSILQSKVHPDDLDEMIKAITFAIENRSIYELEYRICPTAGEERWVNSRGKCTYDTGAYIPSRFSGVVYDITEQKRARDLAENAVRARDNMISISAHELLTPISGTKLHLQILKSKLAKGEELSRDALIKIASQTDHNLNRLTKLVSDMLDVSRINMGKLTLRREQINLSALIEDTVDHSLPTMESAGCTTKISIEPKIEAFVDPYRMEQVLSNLISNACRYAYGKPVEISLTRVNSIARLTVADNGVGIKEEDQDRIFERFERATTLNEKAGLGLGLFLVKQIVEAHGGKIFLESRVGQGAEFTIEVPLLGG
jgi:PAS domain S-box-containing protein